MHLKRIKTISNGVRHSQAIDYVLSKVLIKGFGSNAGWVAGPDRRFTGMAPSASSSMKSRVIKSLVEKSSSEKLGPWGNKALEPDPDSALSLALIDIVAAGPRGTPLVCGGLSIH